MGDCAAPGLVEPRPRAAVPILVVHKEASARSWRHIARNAAIALGVLVALVVAAVAALVIYIGSAGFRGKVEQHAGVALGREFKVGELTIDWSWTPRINASDVTIGGAAKDAPPLLEAKTIQFQ